MTAIPETMQAAELREYKEGLENIELFAVTKETPKPGPDEVLVRVAASPINPSDLAFLQGQYGIKKRLPVVGGFEASGTVVASGGGEYADSLVGKRIACLASLDKGGPWAEYMATPAAFCMPLLDSVNDEQGSMVFVNPMTAYAMLDKARKAGAKGVVQTAAAGALGQMIFRLAKSWDMNVVNIVRREEQAAELKSIGAETVVLSSSPKFERELLVACKKNEATFGMDAVAGQMTVTMAGCMPRGSTIIVYGALSGEAIPLHPGVLIFMEQKLEGFWLSPQLQKLSNTELSEMSNTVQKMIGEEFSSEVRSKYSTEDATKAVQEYGAKMSGGKVLICPGQGK